MSEDKLIDNFGRQVTYLRMSVTDRCDFRCVYCMAEDMKFLPRSAVLSLEEQALIAKAFRGLGVTRLRVTGGEPLVRQNIDSLFECLAHLRFDDLSITTNGSRLKHHAAKLKQYGVHRINVSLDTLNPIKFQKITRFGKLDDVLSGLDTAAEQGFDRIKINSVILKQHNGDEIEALCEYALSRGFDISFIEEMPLGQIDSHIRKEEFFSSADIRERLSRKLDLKPSSQKTGGPSRYWSAEGYSSRIGFISPHSHNFCDTCNRVRLTTEGRLLLCLGNEHSVNLKPILRDNRVSCDDEKLQLLKSAIKNAMVLKPEKHHFDDPNAPQIVRFMNTTGG